MEFTRLEEVRAGWSGDRKYHAWDDGGQEFFLRLSPPEKWEKDLSQNGKILRQVFFSWERGDQV